MEDPGETSDLSDQLPDLKAAMMLDYEAYADRVGVLPLPEGYDVIEQIGANIAQKVWLHYWPWIVAVGVTILGLFIAMIWGVWRFLIRGLFT